MNHWSNKPSAADRALKWRSYWNLFLSLVGRDIRARYRRTILGPLWAIIPAILTTAIFSFLHRVVEIDTEGAPHLVFVFAATVPWTYFQTSVIRIPFGILANGTLLRKMAVPRFIFPLVVLATTFFDFVMSSIVLFVALLLYQMPITWAWLWLPALVAMVSLLAWGVGIGIAAFTVYRRDMLHGLQYFMQVWLFLTPVIYSSKELASNLQIVYRLNPTVGIIDGFRSVLIFGQSPDLESLFISLVVTLLILLVAFPLFQVLSQYFADVL